MDIRKALKNIGIPSSNYCLIEDNGQSLIVNFQMCPSDIDLPVALAEYVLSDAENNTITDAHIICFGNRLYGGLIPKIWNHYPDINIKLLMCNPNASSISYNTQFFLKNSKALEAQLKKVIEHNNNSLNKTELHIVDSPSTLRACVLYSDDKPMICCYQRYQITTGRLKGRQYTPCFIAFNNDSENDFIMKSLVNSIEDEFTAMEESEIMCYLDDQGGLVYG